MKHQHNNQTIILLLLLLCCYINLSDASSSSLSHHLSAAVWNGQSSSTSSRLYSHIHTMSTDDNIGNENSTPNPDDDYSSDSAWCVLILSPLLYVIVSAAIFLRATKLHTTATTTTINTQPQQPSTDNQTSWNDVSESTVQRLTTSQRLLILFNAIGRPNVLLCVALISNGLQLAGLTAALISGWSERCGGASGVVLHWLVVMRLATALLSIRIAYGQTRSHIDLIAPPISDCACAIGWNCIVAGVSAIVAVTYPQITDECQVQAPILFYAIVATLGLSALRFTVVLILSLIAARVSTTIQQNSNSNGEETVLSDRQIRASIMLIGLRSFQRHLVSGWPMSHLLLGCQLDTPDPLCGLELTFLPVIKYSAVTADEHTTCSVCLIDFTEGESVRQLQCRHVFHAQCVDTWLRVKASCPLDRREVNVLQIPLRLVLASMFSRKSMQQDELANDVQLQLQSVAVATDGNVLHSAPVTPLRSSRRLDFLSCATKTQPSPEPEMQQVQLDANVGG